MPVREKLSGELSDISKCSWIELLMSKLNKSDTAFGSTFVTSDAPMYSRPPLLQDWPILPKFHVASSSDHKLKSIGCNESVGPLEVTEIRCNSSDPELTVALA